MSYRLSWKILQRGDCCTLATIQCHSHYYSSHNKITTQLISSSSTNSNTNAKLSSIISPHNNFTEKSFKNAKLDHQQTFSVVETKNLVEKPYSRRSLWLQKSLFGSKKFRSIILLNVICIIYASNISIIKDVEGFTDPAYFSAIRFAVSTIPFIPFILQSRDDIETRNSGLELGLWVSLGYLCEALGLLTSDAARASFISLFTVIVIPVIESVLGAIVPVHAWFGILMSVLGLSMLECSGSPPNIGDIFNFISAIFFGIHTLRTQHISKRTRRKDKLLALLGYEVGVVAVVSALWCIIGGNINSLGDSCSGDGWRWDLFWDWILGFPWIPALYTGVFSTGICLWGEIAAMREVSATETAVIYGLEPVWGAGFAWFVLGERWELGAWIGAALVLGGSLTVQIFGGANSDELRSEGNEIISNKKECEILLSSDSKNLDKTLLSASPVMVRPRNNVLDVFKK